MFKYFTFLLILTSFFVALLAPSFSVSAVDEATVVKLQNPIGGTAEKPEGKTDIRAIYGTAIKAVLGILGSLSLVAFIYGGVLWLTSAGSSERIKKGLNSMLYAAIGMFVIFATYGILTTVIEGLTK
ncbi:MAG: hypothetical protein COU33_04745 [Candidatus Magasanikbacteria bacterium CG10_big_fil_rev_8_21_14_0_10_43_6]|uniref:TrbC/VIRB2 family protein n=1 Tax=Candidatus Magasanikbacteria bacterium CG10_big_fil_rev_8_21_14_0_10_43_6 TaxID=1974650 RepID=A0A2M6W022_9BACT|nr:MAG: hypothetical protein COU33_04745 [Candidatus Magasanikbacteria bacterium CG10_big_fil_rev_8_21_14_0_10_43_6]